MSAVSSYTANPAAPSPDRRCSNASYASGMSNAAAGSTGFDTPENAAFNVRFGWPPPQSATTSENGVPS